MIHDVKNVSENGVFVPPAYGNFKKEKHQWVEWDHFLVGNCVHQ